MIEIKDLSVTYRNEQPPSLSSLQDINLIFDNPSLTLIVGESGSGKSTLANCIMGILHQFHDCSISGSIRFNGIEYETIDYTILNQKIGFLPQYPADFVLNQVVRDEITFSLENLGWGKNIIEKRLSEVLHQLKIEHLANRIIFELSSGELQKVAIATAIAPNPQILILDEPFARNDSISVTNLLDILQYLKEKGLIILIFEHHLDFILEKADRLIILNEGKIIADDTPRKCFHLLKEKLTPELLKVTFEGQKSSSLTFDEIFKDLAKFLLEKYV